MYRSVRGGGAAVASTFRKISRISPTGANLALSRAKMLVMGFMSGSPLDFVFRHAYVA